MLYLRQFQQCGRSKQELKANNDSINKIRVDFVGQYFTVLRMMRPIHLLFIFGA